MAVMAVCGVLLTAGLAAGVVWSTRSFRSPPLETDLSAGEAARRIVWYSCLVLLGGVAAGITVIGAGGRLAMRLLAVTGGSDAQGRVTEAGEVVGRISVDGTVGFILFNGIFGGTAAAALFLVTRRLLPPGRLGALVFGPGLLVVVGTTVDPLRDENPDFDIVGPAWLSVAVFALLAVAFGLALAGITARLSAWLPPPSMARRALLLYAMLAPLALVGLPVLAPLAVVGAAVVVATRWGGGLAALARSPRAVLVGRVVLGGLVLAALPNAVTSVVDILGR